MKVLVFAEQRNGQTTAGSLDAVRKARELADEVAVLTSGRPPHDAAAILGSAGATRVYITEQAFDSSLPQPQVDALASLARSHGFDTVIFSTSTLASDVAAGLAARLEAGVNWGLTDIYVRDGRLLGSQPILDDTILAEVGWKSPPHIAVFRSCSVRAATPVDTPVVEHVAFELEEWSVQTTVRETESVGPASSQLERADVVVAGGRGVGGPAGFELLERLAATLGGAVGASMLAVDAGWYARDAQIGQSGATVHPKVYIACGISGAMQHRIGMDRSARIVAVNTDPAAPIFGFCDVGVVGDVNAVVARVLELLEARQNGGAP